MGVSEATEEMMESIEERYVRRLKEKLRQKLTKNAKKPLMGRLTKTLRDHLTLDEEGGDRLI